MKKVLILVWCLASAILVIAEEPAAPDSPGRLLVGLEGNLFLPADGRFADLYSSGGIHPGIYTGYRITGRIYIAAGYDYMFHRGETLNTRQNTEITQHTLKLSAGYRGLLSGRLYYRAEAGIFWGFYREEVLERIMEGSGFGVLAEGKLLYPLPWNLRAVVFLGYRYGTDSYEGMSLKLGGVRGGVGLGISL